MMTLTLQAAATRFFAQDESILESRISRVQPCTLDNAARVFSFLTGISTGAKVVRESSDEDLMTAVQIMTVTGRALCAGRKEEVTDDQVSFILRQLKSRQCCYLAQNLQGELSRFNGKAYTMQTRKLEDCVKDSILRRGYSGSVPKRTAEVCDELVKRHILGRAWVSHYLYGKYPVYFLNLKNDTVKEVFLS